jgi:hypothetical protein
MLTTTKVSLADIAYALISKDRRYDLVLSEGVNVGAQTLTLARSARHLGKVYAFEPSDFELEERKFFFPRPGQI